MNAQDDLVTIHAPNPHPFTLDPHLQSTAIAIMSTPTVTSPPDEVGSDDSVIFSSTPPLGRPPSILSIASVDAESDGDQRRRSPSRDVAPGSPMSSRLSLTAPVFTPNDIETFDHSLDDNGKETTRPQSVDVTSSASSWLEPSHPERINVNTDTPANTPPEEKQASQDEQIRGFASLPRQLTGWAAVEKTLTDFDKQEIGGYKEDIDSLLTFKPTLLDATEGLYSAVLTAFVIVSFTQLQEDTAAESLKVLRFIANQTSGGTALGGQLANTTTVLPLADPPPFQPTITAIRVNVLWFASLAISLSTASFAILVKQWLREYMAFSSSSPQGQMRVRHLRRSGLEDWHALGIASMLPLLLQISLALFFVGLCFFTADIHPAIGNTTIPLVCAWAFLFIVVTLSPIFSVRCPYKTPALASITTALRIHVYAPFAALMPDLRFVSLVAIFFVVATPIYGLAHLIRNAAKAAGLASSLWEWVKSLDKFLLSISISIESMTARFRKKFEAKIWDEKEASRDGTKDLVILASADTIQDNPELDADTIEAALDQIKPHWTDVTELLVTLIGNRIPWPAFAEGPENATVDLTTLSPKTRGAIQLLFLRHVASGPLYMSLKDSAIEHPHLYPSGAWVFFMSLFIRYGPEVDLVLPDISIWKDSYNLLLVHLRGYSKHGTQAGPLLILWVCAYISQAETHYSCEEDLREEMNVLRRAIELYEQKSTTLPCDHSVSGKLGSLAKRAACCLMESADNLRPPHHDWSTSTLYYDTVLLVLKLCSVVYLAGHRIDCKELLGHRFRELVSLRTRATKGHKEMMTLCMSLPPHYVWFYLDGGLMDGRIYQEDDCISIGNAISAIARDTIIGDIAIARILNLSLIALSMEYTKAERWLEQLPCTTGTEEPSDRLQMFNLLASALAKTRKPNKKSAIHTEGNEERDAVGYCWSRIAYKFITAVHDDLEDLDLANFPYLSYFLLEISLLLTGGIRAEMDPIGHILFQKMQSMSEIEKNGIRERGEGYIGRSASNREESIPANRGILRLIEGVIRTPAQRQPSSSA